MLSGFLMQLVLAEKYNPRSDMFLFYSNRALRIYPTYFLALLFSVLVSAVLLPYSAGFFHDIRAAIPVLTPFDWIRIALSHVFILGQDMFVFEQFDSTSLHYTAAGVGNAAETLLILPPAWSISLSVRTRVAVATRQGREKNLEENPDAKNPKQMPSDSSAVLGHNAVS
jgi:peptidoglycan/LPS O-acetylase OafA/YrhL